MRFVIVFFMCSLIAPSMATAQAQINENLNIAIEGSLSLLWKKEDGHYRFYSKKGSEITELLHPMEANEDQKDYKEVLSEHSGNSIPVKGVNYNFRSLYNFYSQYNRKEEDPDDFKIKMEHRFGFLMGIDNVVYAENPENVLHPFYGFEYELSETGKRRRSSLLLQFTKVQKMDEHDLSVAKLSLKYRFKIVRSRRADFFLNVGVVDYYFNNKEDEHGNPSFPSVYSISNVYLDAPFSIGAGADIKVGKGYITIAYPEFVSFNRGSNSNFPVNASVGYKMAL